MTLESQLKKVEEIKSGERTLLQEAHELVINEGYPDLPEALDFITDADAKGSLMNLLIQDEEYEECSKLLLEKIKILNEIENEELEEEF